MFSSRPTHPLGFGRCLQDGSNLILAVDQDKWRLQLFNAASDLQVRFDDTTLAELRDWLNALEFLGPPKDGSS